MNNPYTKKKTESPKETRDQAAERIASLFNHGMTDAEIVSQVMFDIDPITLVGIIRDLMHDHIALVCSDVMPSERK